MRKAGLLSVIAAMLLIFVCCAVVSADDYQGPIDFERFEYFDDVLNRGVPKSATFLPVKYIPGVWKYEIRIYTQDVFTEIGFADVELDTVKDNMTITLHPRYARYGTEIEPEDDKSVGYKPFTGTWDNNEGVYLLKGNNLEVHIESYFADSGREYMMSTVYKNGTRYGHLFFQRGQE